MSGRRRPSWLPALFALALFALAISATTLAERDYCPVSTLPVFEGSEPQFAFSDLTHYRHIFYKCKRGFKPINESVFTMVCRKGIWHPNKDFCKRIYCGQPPNITAGFHNGNATTYPFGTIVHYSCSKNLSLIGASFMVCSANKNRTGLWKEKPPICKGVFCKDPVVEHGIQITEPEKLYIYGSKVIFQCKSGYFMIGNYLIQCEKNNVWIPIVPSCKKISRGICGPPLILNGNIQPLQPQYETGKIAIITCNQNYSFIDDTTIMTIQCQGYNIWNPPAQLCFLKTSPDIFHLFINNGKIVHGKKKYYEPGDEVDIACYGGYVLKGPSKIKYIGGKKWFPSIPNCHLSNFLKLVICACSIPVWILAIKMFYQKYIEERLNKREKNEKEENVDTETIMVLGCLGNE